METPKQSRTILNEKIAFIVASGWNTLIGCGSFFTFYHLLHKNVHYLAIITLSHFLCVINNWLIFRWLVFRSKSRLLPEYIRYNLTSIFILCFQFFGLWLLVELFGFQPIPSQLALVATTLILSYGTHKYYAFRI